MKIRKVLLIVLTLISVLCLSSCAKLVSETTSQVEATVVSTETTRHITQYRKQGKRKVMVPEHTTYSTTLNYKGNNYSIAGKETYDFCKDRDKVMCNLSIKKYDNGETRENIVSVVTDEDKTI